MSKCAHRYRLRLEQAGGIQPDSSTHEPLELELKHHDDIFNIIERLQKRNSLQEPGQSTEFAIGLKLVGEVRLKNSQHLLFEELAPAFKSFVQRLKALMQE